MTQVENKLAQQLEIVQQLSDAKQSSSKQDIISQIDRINKQLLQDKESVFQRVQGCKPQTSQLRLLAQSFGNRLLYPSPSANRQQAYSASLTDQWIEFSKMQFVKHTNQALSSSRAQNYVDARGSLIESLKVLDLSLHGKTYINGHYISLADIVLVTDLKPAFTEILEEAQRKLIPSVTRWFLTVVNQKPFSTTLDVHLCEKAKEPWKLKKEERAASSTVPATNGVVKQGKPNKNKPNQQQKPQQQQQGGSKNVKKQTKEGLQIKKEDDYGQWFVELCVKSELITYYSQISGCYILRPDSYEIWEQVQKFFDKRIKSEGVRNAYFPLLLTKDQLEKEQDHVEGFSAEVAWVTKSGNTELENPIAIRPTSETVMYPYYAQWIRSHRDLPLLLNQWTNVIRWEFKHPTPFIRSREFLWQEGHTAHSTLKESEEFAFTILNYYREVFEDLLAVPVIPGRKSANERFAGADETYSVEGFVSDTGKGIQSATSHVLGQNFSKMFGIQFQDKDGQQKYVWQNSWGLSTRSIGAMVMMHSDNNGLVIPPRAAPRQVVFVNIPVAGKDKSKEEKDQVDNGIKNKIEDLKSELVAREIRAVSDTSDNEGPAWKFNNYELKGIPLRIEVGSRDMESQQVVIVRRDNFEKIKDVKWSDLAETVEKLLEKMQNEIYQAAAKRRDESLVKAFNWDDFMEAITNKKMVLAPWCDTKETEEQVKKRSTVGDLQGAKTLCIPLQQPDMPQDCKCFATGEPAKNFALWGRSY